jgi:NAD-dependent SIR2 family protein deacetylase
VTLEEKISTAAHALAQADALLICAGAGMGVDSGLPDFRGPEGFWKSHPVIAKLGYPFEQIANPKWFADDPKFAWGFYGHRLNLYRKTQPHAGFGQLLRIGKEKKHGFFVFTSNVDGQFQKAGCPEDRIVECHGSIHYFQCAKQCSGRVWEADNEQVVVEEETLRAAEPLPKCRLCGGLARPNILMFDDWQWTGDRTDYQRLRFADWLKQLVNAGAKLVAIEIGAGTAVPAVRFTSERMVGRLEGSLVRINPRENEVPAGQIGLPIGAAEGIQKIVEQTSKIAGP